VPREPVLHHHNDTCRQKEDPIVATDLTRDEAAALARLALDLL